MPSRVARGGRAAVDFVVFWVEQIFHDIYFFRFSFLFERTRHAASMRAPCLNYLSNSTRVPTGCHYLISLYVGLSVCACV